MDPVLEPAAQCPEDGNASKFDSAAFQLVPSNQNLGKTEAVGASSPNYFEKSGMETDPSNRKYSKSHGEKPFLDLEQVLQNNEGHLKKVRKEKPREYLLLRNKMERKRMEVNASHKARLDILERKEELIREEMTQLKCILKRRKAELRRLKKRMKKLNVKKEHDNSIIDCQEELELLNLIPVTEEWG